jgi:hypothetical protein
MGTSSTSSVTNHQHVPILVTRCGASHTLPAMEKLELRRSIYLPLATVGKFTDGQFHSTQDMGNNTRRFDLRGNFKLKEFPNIIYWEYREAQE